MFDIGVDELSLIFSCKLLPCLETLLRTDSALFFLIVLLFFLLDFLSEFLCFLCLAFSSFPAFGELILLLVNQLLLPDL
jgi:hypothetical protein